jgi:molybdenum cofactor cytidylyltransferase
LINYYEFNKPSILAPFIGEKRGNPVLFDKICFNQLHHLQGDKGGRALFNEFGLTRLKWEDENILLDVDSPEDYLNLKEKYE